MISDAIVFFPEALKNCGALVDFDPSETPEDGMQSVIDVALTPNIIIYHDNTREITTSTTSVNFNPDDNLCKTE